MAPDADKLRQRKATAMEDAAAANATQDNRMATMKSLKPTEICIDGTIYDISNFEHPGGPTIDLFGGNDVTVQYRMIHPYHTSKHLEKMTKVGTVVDYTTEYVYQEKTEKISLTLALQLRLFLLEGLTVIASLPELFERVKFLMTFYFCSFSQP